jgi:hypothetical protein
MGGGYRSHLKLGLCCHFTSEPVQLQYVSEHSEGNLKLPLCVSIMV